MEKRPREFIRSGCLGRCLFAFRQGFTVLAGFGVFDKLGAQPFNPDEGLNFAEFDVTEEFATWVDHVQSSLSEELVQGVLQFWRVVRVKHGMQVKRKGHAGSPKFDN